MEGWWRKENIKRRRGCAGLGEEWKWLGRSCGNGQRKGSFSAGLDLGFFRESRALSGAFKWLHPVSLGRDRERLPQIQGCHSLLMSHIHNYTHTVLSLQCCPQSASLHTAVASANLQRVQTCISASLAMVLYLFWDVSLDYKQSYSFLMTYTLAFILKLKYWLLLF